MIQDNIDYSAQILQWEAQFENLKSQQHEQPREETYTKSKKNSVPVKPYPTKNKIQKPKENSYPEKRANSGEQTKLKPKGKTQKIRFHFNPNTISKDSLQMLPIHPNAIRNIVKYRLSGGKFYKAEDVKKIYGMAEGDFEKIQEDIIIPSNTKKNKTYASSYIKKDPSIQIEINKANIEEWQKLKGIGPYTAKKIIAYREKLGGFYTINQVGETWALPDSVFQHIKPQLRIVQANQKLTINNIEFDQLVKHPYLSSKKAKIILNYITQHGSLKNKKDLYNIRILDSIQVNKLHPYFDYQQSVYSASK